MHVLRFHFFQTYQFFAIFFQSSLTDYLFEELTDRITESFKEWATLQHDHSNQPVTVIHSQIDIGTGDCIVQIVEFQTLSLSL